MTANLTRDPNPDDVAEAAARLTGTPQEMADQLRALLDAEPPQVRRRESTEETRDRQRTAHRQRVEIDALRLRLAFDFATSRGWQATTAPIAVRELARRSAGGNWHRPPHEWSHILVSPTFFRDSGRRAAAAVGHPPAEAVDASRNGAEAWAAERSLVLSFPDFPSWQDPGRSVLAVFESAEPVEVERRGASDPVSAGVPSLARHGVDSAEVPHPAPEAVAQHEAPKAHAMRPVVPIDLGPIVPADLSDQIGPDFDLVAPTDLLIDGAYQRDLSPKSLALIRRIVRTWSWAKFKPPVCTRIDGRLHIIDGQHSAIGAATHGAIPIIPVVVVEAPEVMDRAAAFVSHATDRVQVTPIQVWRAAVLAGDEDAMTIANVCRQAGVDLLPFAPTSSEYAPRQTVALAGIRRLVDRRGAMRARQVLEAIAKADLAPITGDHLKIGEALLCDPDYAGDFDQDRLTAAMRGLGAKAYAEARELSIAKRIPAWRALVAVIYRGRKGRPKGLEADDAAQGRRRASV